MSCEHNQLMTAEQIQTWILARLGAPMVKVELQACHLEIAVDDAKRWYVSKKGHIRYRDLDVVANQVEYHLPEDVERVLEVYFPETGLDVYSAMNALVMPYAQIPYNAWSSPANLGFNSLLYQYEQYNETTMRVLNAEPDWDHPIDSRSLFLFPPKNLMNKVKYKYKARCITIEQLSEKDHGFVKDYALAIAKETLGRIRAKYPAGSPSAQGERALDGESLLQESAAAIERLNEEISLSSYPMGMAKG